ncbi:hypothetical protein HPC49_05510 [Pyxidicoccus fallax]|uniref:Type II toxin-antitoxin system RelE/ParE family toxin n=1 Tax=Pyxidicoccus fallax TaxID=394095 RepID=A0A848LCJ8_9BACT|nr:hypothetical protein [Pyxidicoccus fallax]NMO16206.1 hypothetical protein [Pyxidicoccus fallax]NPC77711.1 hypothetical protein [Pyxidicoccus fallax]
MTDAWGQVSHLPRDTYREIQARLESLAAQTSAYPTPPPDVEKEAAPSFRMGDLLIHYTVDPRRRLIRLMRISRERATPTVSKRQGEETSG